MNPEKLNDYWREHFEERSAIFEYDSGMTRHDAEQAAWDDVSLMIFRGER